MTEQSETNSNYLLLRLDAFEGPIDVLLQLARDQKLDLSQVSILQLARQYLGFIDQAQRLSLDIAAEYLVMAAWLAYLKSKLLLPAEQTANDEPSAEMMAEALAFQLRRLETIQKSAENLRNAMYRNLSVHGRGWQEKFVDATPDHYKVDLYQLLKAYGNITQRQTSSHYKPVSFPVMSMGDAMARLTKMLGRLPKSGSASMWTTLSSFVPTPAADQEGRELYTRSALASLLTSALELAKQGTLELRQDDHFRPIYLRTVEKVVEKPHDDNQHLQSE